MGRLVREVNKARGARFTTRSNESPLIALDLFVEGRATPLRALVDSGASENFIRSRSLSDSLNYKEKRSSPSRLLVVWRRVQPSNSTNARCSLATPMKGEKAMMNSSS